MRRFVFTLLVLALPSVVQAQTVTPQLVGNFTVSPAAVATYVTTVQIGTGLVLPTTPACVGAGTGAVCTVTLTGALAFDATKPTTFTWVVVDPGNGRTANTVVNYVPGVAPPSFTVGLQWKICVLPSCP